MAAVLFDPLVHEASRADAKNWRATVNLEIALNLE
jgi:hypothetical protein